VRKLTRFQTWLSPQYLDIIIISWIIHIVFRNTKRRRQYVAASVLIRRQNLRSKVKYKTIVHSLPEQVMPSPEYPSRQVQVKVPGVLVQFACEWQFPLLLAHSLTSITTQQNISPQYKLTKINTCTKRLKKYWGLCPVDMPSWPTPIAQLVVAQLVCRLFDWQADIFISEELDIYQIWYFRCKYHGYKSSVYTVPSLLCSDLAHRCKLLTKIF